MRETDRDHAMFEWLGAVRVADVDAIRWALAGVAGRSEPVSVRRAQQWIARCRDAGLIETARPLFRDGAVVWVSHQISGRPAPDLHRQTTRHEVAVGAAAARFLARGYEWQRDRRPVVPKIDHQADGVGLRDGERILVEVELTPKTDKRYRDIFANHLSRHHSEGVTAVVYFCTTNAAVAVQKHVDSRPAYNFIHVLDVFDVRGRWASDKATAWPELSGHFPTSRVDAAQDAAASAATLWGGQP